MMIRNESSIILLFILSQTDQCVPDTNPRT